MDDANLRKANILKTELDNLKAQHRYYSAPVFIARDTTIEGWIKTGEEVNESGERVELSIKMMDMDLVRLLTAAQLQRRIDDLQKEYDAI